LAVGLPVPTPRIDPGTHKTINNQPATPRKRSHLPCYALGHLHLPTLASLIPGSGAAAKKVRFGCETSTQLSLTELASMGLFETWGRNSGARRIALGVKLPPSSHPPNRPGSGAAAKKVRSGCMTSTQLSPTELAWHAQEVKNKQRKSWCDCRSRPLAEPHFDPEVRVLCALVPPPLCTAVHLPSAARVPPL